jgi:hypothetical protein
MGQSTTGRFKIAGVGMIIVLFLPLLHPEGMEGFGGTLWILTAFIGLGIGIRYMRFKPEQITSNAQRGLTFMFILFSLIIVELLGSYNLVPEPIVGLAALGTLILVPICIFYGIFAGRHRRRI